MTYGYTLFCVIALGLTLGLEAVLRTGVLRSGRFWTAMAIVGCFQVLVDGWLTCRPVVTYAASQFSGARLGCPRSELFRAGGMPLEDVLFGFAMITQALIWWVWWGRRIDGADERKSRADRRCVRQRGVTSLAVGDWVMVHLGFAMAKIDAAHARETRAFLNELGLDL